MGSLLLNGKYLPNNAYKSDILAKVEKDIRRWLMSHYWLRPNQKRTTTAQNLNALVSYSQQRNGNILCMQLLIPLLPNIVLDNNTFNRKEAFYNESEDWYGKWKTSNIPLYTKEERPISLISSANKAVSWLPSQQGRKQSWLCAHEQRKLKRVRRNPSMY